ncbi:dienelactone hydrolase family protein [Salinigranum marinum]|uniref:dienelactone hydrolase family protein n=1 Tax=Salinigranum marinum TaxID=1515595 RepID=UPI002989CD3F|nr:dienelactone hydrolase family protein [Salinigranum marinum]
MDVVVGGVRDVRATLDGGAGAACVVACPPHPQHGGSRSDGRLRAVSDALVERELDCLRIDYGPWTDGAGEVRDARASIRHCREVLGYDRVGLFGYSFGGAVALLAAAEGGAELAAVSALAPAHRLAADLDAATAAGSLAVPTQVVAGARDTTVEWEPVVDAVRERGGDVVELPADHFFVGQAESVADAVAPFLAAALC